MKKAEDAIELTEISWEKKSNWRF